MFSFQYVKEMLLGEKLLGLFDEVFWKTLLHTLFLSFLQWAYIFIIWKCEEK